MNLPQVIILHAYIVTTPSHPLLILFSNCVYTLARCCRLVYYAFGNNRIICEQNRAAFFRYHI